MEKNKDKDMTQAPINGAPEDELQVQDTQAEAGEPAEVDSARIDEIVETLEAEESVEEAADDAEDTPKASPVYTLIAALTLLSVAATAVISAMQYLNLHP